MIDLRKIDELARKLTESLPPGAQKIADDAESQFKSVLQRGMSEMGLVTREDFELQKAALERARAKLTELEQRLETLEAG